MKDKKDNKKTSNNNTNEEDIVRTFVLVNQEGDDIEVELLDFIDYDEKLYSILIPVSEEENSEDEDHVIIMKTVFVENEPEFTLIEEEALAQKILDEYTRRLNDE